MTYGLSAQAQLSNFLSAIGFGFLIAVLYYLIVFIREVCSRKKAFIIAQDIIFSLAASFLWFIFMQVYSNGEVRIDLLAAALIGFAVFVLTAGRFWGRVRAKAVKAVRSFFKAFFSPLVLVYNLINKIFSKVFAEFKRLYLFVKNKIKRTEKSEKNKGSSSKKERENKRRKIFPKANKKTKKNLNKLSQMYVLK